MSKTVPINKIKILIILQIVSIVAIIGLAFCVYLQAQTNKILLDSESRASEKIFNLEGDLRARGIIQGELGSNVEPYSLEQLQEYQVYVDKNPCADSRLSSSQKCNEE